MDHSNSRYSGGASRQSALRNSRSPPRNNDYRPNGARTGSQGKNPSPLRSRIAQQSSQPQIQSSQQSARNSQMQDEIYERQRQNELRRQIEEKERELEQMSQKNRDRFSRHQAPFSDSQGLPDMHSIGSGAQQPMRIHRQSNSPMRSATANNPNYTSFARASSGGPMRTSETAKDNHGLPPHRLTAVASSRPPIPQVDNYTRQKSPNSPLRKNNAGSRSPTRDVDMRDASYGLLTGVQQPRSSVSPVRSASNEYLRQLQQDNSSLQKRLNLVLQELDRVNRDRSSLVQKSSILEQDINNLQVKLNAEDSHDKINNDLQLDVNGTRDNNIGFKRQINETDVTRNDAIQRLRNLQSERDRKTHMCNEITTDLQRKLTLCSQLEQEQFQAHEKINDYEQQISGLNRVALQDNTQIEDVRRITEKLAGERDDLQLKLEQLNRTYDNCVSEISRERAQMQGHNRHHNKLLVAKLTFILLEHMFKKRKQEAINEFFTYCKFDQKCHGTLKTFVKTIERLGQYRLKIAIKQWHQRTFKPIEMKVQEADLCYNFMRKHLLSRMFNQWRWRQQNAESLYGAKNKALKMMWGAKEKDCARDVQRYFQIWKDNMNYQQHRETRCKKMVWRAYSNRLAGAFQKWQNYSKWLDGQVRLHVLAKEFAESQLKRNLFNEMRYQLFDMRRKRHNRLRTYVKAWRESRQYSKFILAANMTVLGFKKDCNKSLMKMCFDALRISKEEEKFVLMSEALEGDCQPAIEAVSKSIELKTQQAVRSGRNRGLDAIKAMIYRQVGEYFFKWRNVEQRTKVKMNDNLKGMIIRRWNSRLSDAFNLWKRGQMNKEIVLQDAMVMEMQEEGSNLAAAVDDLSKNIEMKKKTVDRSARQTFDRGTRIMKKRWLKQYMDKWAAINKHANKQTDGSETILQRMRNRFLRQAFNLYKAGCAREQLSERNEGSCEHLKHTLDVRLMRKCFLAMRQFNTQNGTAKRYTNILLNKMDHWMKKRAFATWLDGGNTMKIEMHLEHQNALTEEMTVKNNELGTLTKKVADKNARNEQLNNNLKHMGQRSMANAFARAYFVRTAHGLEKWKEWFRAENHKKAIIKRTMEHWLKGGQKYLIAIFADWKAKAGISDTKANIAQMQYEMNDMALVQGGDTVEFEKKKAALIEQTQATRAEHDQHLSKRNKVMALMTENNQGMHYTGKLRCIFTEWARYTKRQRRFADNIISIVQRSVWQKGFQNIREFARDKQLTRCQNKGFAKVRQMFWRRNCHAAFSKWRQTEYEQSLEMITMTEENTMQMQQEHVQRKKVIQKQNITRSERLVGKTCKHKYYQAWKNVTRLLKHKRVSTGNLLQAMSSYAVKRSIKKWRARAETTKAARAAYEKFQQKRDLIYKRGAFRELMLKHHRDKALILRLSNTAGKFDNRMLQSAFQMIRNYWTTKNNVQAHEKGVSSRNLGDTLSKIYRRKLLQHYSHLRRQTHGGKVAEKKMRTVFGHFISASVRDAFARWKKQSDFAQTVIEVNEIGPISEEVLDARLAVHNLQYLMADEGFNEHEIADVTDRGEKKGLELLSTAVGRWRCWNGTDDYLKPKMFDRWRKFVQMRKIVRHWLNFLTNRQEHQKADLGHAFSKWKHFFSDKQDALQKRTRAQLLTRAVKAAKRLEVLADSTQQDEDMINHLSDQNEELFTNYRKSQRLALALGRDNHKFCLMKGVTRLQDSAAAEKERQLEAVLQRNVDMIAATKDKINEIENDNDSLANENEELRQFSLDGYQLGKNVQNLTAEREKLSVDLADKANTIKKLLDENERLSQRLRQAQDTAANLLASQSR